MIENLKTRSLLKSSIKGCILDLVRDTNALIFQGTSKGDSAVIFKCADEKLSSG
jgi:hypothetical protein